MSVIEKPSPRGEGLNGEFYAHCTAGQLHFQRCDDCGTFRHMPRHTCANCHSWNWQWTPSSGRGKLYSWTICNRSFHPAFNESLPYAICVIELEEGVRVLSHMPWTDMSAFTLDMPVEVDYLPRGEVKLPVFRPAAS